jgi:lipoprotein-anchoring transpeptidase ErfK/SrfK
MSVFKANIGGVLAAAVLTAGLVAGSGMAVAQQKSEGGLIEFLWGGEPEYGGQKRQVVSFDSKYAPGQIIVSFGDRRLYHITKAGQAMSYPIAIPREQSRWQGNTVVSSKRENPDWRPTPDMLKENPRLPSWVPGGHPMNPLGVRALYLGSSTYRIHGTDAPWTIGQNVSKGCIRMFNEDVMHLYPLVPVGTKVIVTWDRFKTDGVNVAEEATDAPKPVAKKRAAANNSKSGFFVFSSANAAETEPSEEAAAAAQPGSANDTSANDTSALDSDEGLTQEEGATVYVRQPDGSFAPEQAGEERSEAPAAETGKTTRLNRKVGAGAVSRAASERTSAVQ